MIWLIKNATGRYFIEHQGEIIMSEWILQHPDDPGKFWVNTTGVCGCSTCIQDKKKFEWTTDRDEASTFATENDATLTAISMMPIKQPRVVRKTSLIAEAIDLLKKAILEGEIFDANVTIQHNSSAFSGGSQMLRRTLIDVGALKQWVAVDERTRYVSADVSGAFTTSLIGARRFASEGEAAAHGIPRRVSP